MVEIIDFEEKYAADFRKMNLEWLEQFHLLESHDVEVLNDPKGTILDRGGYIYLALVDGQYAGSAGLAREHGDQYELVKMAVAGPFRGQGIARLLLERCIAKAREIGVKKLILYSNSQLQTAIKLYLQYGFQHVPAIDTPFVTADIKMELDL